MKNPNILLVDDYEPTNILHQQFIKIHLPEATVNFFSDPYKALSALKNFEEEEFTIPDIIFLDINMPTMSGWEFLEAFNLLKFDKDINIYVLSTFDDEKYRIKAKKNPLVKNYFTKPLTKIILMQAIFNKTFEEENR